MNGPSEYLRELYEDTLDDGLDCADIVDNFIRKFKVGTSLRITNEQQFSKFAVIEYFQVELFDYHEVYLLDEIVYDARYSKEPIPLNDYKRLLNSINKLIGVKLKYEVKGE